MLATLALLTLMLQTTPPAAPPPDGIAPRSMVVLVQGDALHLQLAAASVKTEAFRQIPTRGPAAHRIVLLNAQGAALASVPLDLSAFCLAPDHVGQPPHARGDTLIDHRVLVISSVPALDGLESLSLERREAWLDEHGQPVWTRLGLVQRATLDKLLTAGEGR